MAANATVPNSPTYSSDRILARAMSLVMVLLTLATPLVMSQPLADDTLDLAPVASDSGTLPMLGRPGGNVRLPETLPLDSQSQTQADPVAVPSEKGSDGVDSVDARIADAGVGSLPVPVETPIPASRFVPVAPVADLPVDDALAVPVDADASMTLVQDEAQAEHIHECVLVDRFDGDTNIG